MFITTIFYCCILFSCTLTLFAQEQNKRSGIIRGTITAPKSNPEIENAFHKRALNRYSKHHKGNNVASKPYTLSEQCVVYIESAPDYAPQSLQKLRAELDQRELTFRPLVLPILAGTTVDFPNRDDLYHNVFSYSSVKEFDLGKYPKNQIKSVTFEKPGVVPVFCDIHTYMFATILVLDNPWFTTPSDDGLYTIPEIPPGSYQLSVWYLRKKVETRSIEIKENQTIEINFKL